MDVVEGPWKPQRKVGTHRDQLRVAAVTVEAREARVGAQVLAIGATLIARPIGRAEPADSGTLAELPTAHRLTRGNDGSDDLMARRDRELWHAHVPFADLKIGATDGAGVNPEEQLIGSRHGIRALHPGKRLIADRSGMVERHRAHGPIVPRFLS